MLGRGLRIPGHSQMYRAVVVMGEVLKDLYSLYSIIV